MTANALLTLGVTNAVLATLLAIAGWCLTRVWKNPHVASIVWLVVLLKLVTPPLIPLPIAVAWEGEAEPQAATNEISNGIEERRAVGVSPPSASPERTDPIAFGMTDEPLPLTSDELTFESPSALRDVPESPLTTLETPVSATAMPIDFDLTRTTEPFPIALVLLAVWSLGIATMALVTIVRVVRFRRCLISAAVARDDVRHEAHQVARRLMLARTPRIAFVEANVGPLVWAGGLRPMVVVPRPLWTTLAIEERDTLLAHEFAHIARRDHWVRRFEAIVLALFWWLPTAWFAVRRREAAAESCCDALVLTAYPERPQAYAQALFHAVSLFSTGRPLPLASGLGRITELKERLAMIAHDKVPTRPSRIVRTGLLLAAMAALLVSAVRANPEEKPKPDDAKASVRDRLKAERPMEEAEEPRWLPVEDLIADSGWASIVVEPETAGASTSEEISYVLVRGIWPLANQRREWERTLGSRSTLENVRSALIDFQIERQPAAPLGGNEQSWERLDLESTNRVLNRARAFAVEASDPQWQSPVITAPLPTKTVGEWKDALHPRLDEAKAGDVILFRYPDFDVPPGETYRYRVRLKLMDKIDGAEAELWTEWSAPTEWVTVRQVNDAKEDQSDLTLDKLLPDEGPFRGSYGKSDSGVGPRAAGSPYPSGSRGGAPLSGSASRGAMSGAAGRGAAAERGGATGRSATSRRSPQVRPSDEAVTKMLAGLAKVIESPKESGEVKIQALRSYGRLARGTAHAKQAGEVLVAAARNANDDRTTLRIAEALHTLGSPKGVELMWTVFSQKPDMDGKNLEVRQTAYRMLDNAGAVPPTVESVRLVAEFLTTSGGGYGAMMGGMPGAFGPSGWLTDGPLKLLTLSPDGIRRLVEATESLPQEEGAMIGMEGYDEAGSFGMAMGGGMASALSPRNVLLNVLKATSPANEEVATALVEALTSKDSGVRAAAAEALGNVSEVEIEKAATEDASSLSNAGSTKLEPNSSKVDPAFGRGQKIFHLLDEDKDGIASVEELSRLQKMRPAFENAGIDLQQPMTESQFIEAYRRADP